MTIAELNRFMASYVRREKTKEQLRASHNYILASLIGCSVASYFSKDINMPKVEEVYSSLFTEQADETAQKKQEVKDTLTIMRFKQFADSHNRKFKK